jgi:hypothetical protein
VLLLLPFLFFISDRFLFVQKAREKKKKKPKSPG